MMRTRRQQRGIVAVFVALAILSLLAMVGLAIDMGHLVLNKARLQSTVDAAALAAAKVLDQTNGNEAAATAEANSVFELNSAKFPDLSTHRGRVTVTVEYSHTLNPFVPGGTPPDYVRVRAAGLPAATTFLVVLGLDELMTRASAVAGPSAPIVTPCDLFPVAVCADMGAGPPNWGYPPYGQPGNTVTLLKLASGAAGSTFGPGNFQLIRLQGSGANVVRLNMAGGSACPAPGAMVDVDPQPGNVTGPVAQGTNTRFGIYQGSLGRGAADYPPDIFTTPAPATPLDSQDGVHITCNGQPFNGLDQLAYSYRNYLSDYDALPADYSGPGVPQRRVVTVPIVDCTHPVGGASGTLPIAGYGCFFLLQPVKQSGTDAWIFAQFVKDCPGSGNPGNQGGPGPYKIVLHNDPDSTDS
ncbi:MAG: hypothetical protein FIB04_04820 [Gammaproteobacteria bacterium]|nr:hypothetical protein [Gammaproteobacteria bacterium]